MEKKYKLEYLPFFYQDLDRITDYIRYNLANEIAAGKLLDEVEKEIQQRLNSPASYEKYITDKNKTYYRIYVKNYTIFYKVKNNTMIVSRILYSRMNFNQIF